MNIPTTSYDEYLKKPVGEWNPETAAYLYTKENQSEGKLQTRHPLIRLVYSHPWVIPVAGVALFWMGANSNHNALPKYQTIQAPSSGQPLIINNVVK